MIIDYSPHKSQQKIHNALIKYLTGLIIMVIAGRRFGKTVLAINEIIKRAIEIPGSRIWYVAPTKEQAYMIAWRLLLYPRVDIKTGKLCPPYLPPEFVKKSREDKHYVELTNGSLIEFKGVQDEIFLLGVYLHFVVFDEFPTIPWTVWVDTVKPMLTDFNGDALFIGTIPDPKVHRITPEFIEMYENLLYKKEKARRGHKAFNFTSFDNPHINKKKIQEDIKDLEKKGRGADAKRIYYGKYTREYGVVFPKFNYALHTVEPFEVPKPWLRAMAVDPHPQKPSNALWCAIDARNGYWFYREREFSNEERTQTVPEVAYDIMITEDMAKEKMKARLIDPTFAKVEQKIMGAKCVKDIFKDCGLWFREADRNFDVFFHKVTDMLVEEPSTFHIFRSCPGFIYQMEHYMWDSYANAVARFERGAKSKPRAVNDDYMSCAKYIINAGLRNFDMRTVEAFKKNLHQKWADGSFL